ncbi:MAG: selenoprotein O, partial [Chakrabartia sp.]
EEDSVFITCLEKALVSSGLSIDQFYFDWSGGQLRSEAARNLYAAPDFEPFKILISAFAPSRALSHFYWKQSTPCSMLIEEVESLWSPIADADDWGPLEQKIKAIRLMGEALSQTL